MQLRHISHSYGVTCTSSSPDCREAAMAAFTFETTHRAAGRLEAVLDAGIVSDAIPAFFIGRNEDGF
jgi:hypothetical protein